MAFLDETGLAELWSLIKAKDAAVVEPFYLHWWKMRTFVAGYVANYGNPVGYDVYGLYNEYHEDKTVIVGDSIAATEDGKIQLINSKSVSFSYFADRDDFASLFAGKYFYPSATSATSYEYVYFAPSDTTGSYSSEVDDYGDEEYKMVLSNVSKVTALYSTTVGEWVYASAPDRNAYPDGVVGGNEYVYVGVPFDNARESIKIEMGSYTGTGKNGSQNPNSLTFSFAPKFVWFTSYAYNASTDLLLHCTIQGNNVVDMTSLTTEYIDGVGPRRTTTNSSNHSSAAKKSEDGKTLSWYASLNADTQMNTANRVYNYIAIG